MEAACFPCRFHSQLYNTCVFDFYTRHQQLEGRYDTAGHSSRRLADETKGNRFPAASSKDSLMLGTEPSFVPQHQGQDEAVLWGDRSYPR